MAGIINMVRMIGLILVLIPVGYGIYLTMLMVETTKVAEGSAEPGVAMKLAEQGVSLLINSQKNSVAATLADTEGLSEERAVWVGYEVPLADLLTAGEAMPEPVFHNLFAEGRVGAFMQARECGAILETIGKACVVVRSEANRADSGDYKVQALLAFAPIDPIGTLTEGHTLDDQGQRVDLLDGPVGGLTPDEAQDLRTTAYREAAAACAAVRQSNGACVIKRVSFAIDDDPRISGRKTVDATATLVTVRPTQ